MQGCVQNIHFSEGFGCICLLVASVIFKISTMEGGRQQIQEMNFDVETSKKIEIDQSYKLELFCLIFPSLDKKICNQLDAQSLMKFTKVREEIWLKSKYFWARKLQNQLRKLYMGKRKIPNDWRYVIEKSPLEIVRGFSTTLKQFHQFSTKNAYCIVKCSPLHLAAECGNLELCRYIIDAIEDKNPKDFSGETPLHWAAEKGHYEVCKLILEKIGDKNPKDVYGNTPLQIAAERGNLKLCQPNGEVASNDDLELCASIILKWKYGNTPLHKTDKSDFIDICHLIIKEVNYTNLKQRNSKSSTAPASSEKPKVEQLQTSENSPSSTSNLIISKTEQYIKPIEQLEVKAASEMEKEESPIVPVLKIKKCSKLESSAAEPPNNDSRIVDNLSIKLNQSKPEVKEPAAQSALKLTSRNLKQKNSKSSTAPASSEKRKVEQPQTSENSPSPTSNLIIPKKERYIKPIEQLEVEVAPETQKEKSPKVPALKIKLPPSPKPKESLLNILTDLTENLPQVGDPVFKIPEEPSLVLPIIEVENDDNKNENIADHIELTDALEIVGRKVENIVESTPNILPDGPTLRIGRKNRGYIEKPDFVCLQ